MVDFSPRRPLGFVVLCAIALLSGVPRSAAAAPTGTEVIAVAATDSVFEDKVVVTWPHTAQANIFYRIKRDAQLLSVVASTDSAYSDYSGVPGTIYSYSVTMLNVADNTQIDVGSDAGSRVLAVPGNVQATDGTFDTKVVVTWSDRSIVEASYQIERDGVAIGQAARDQDAFEDTTAVAGTTYTYCVRIVDAGGHQSRKACDEGTRAFIVPPGSVTASDGQYPAYVALTWTDPSTVESGFNVYRDGSLLVSLPPNSTSFNDSTATASVVHQYCVRTVKGGTLESVPACDAGGRGTLAPPVDVAATDAAFDDRVEITWRDTTATEDGFKVFRDGTLIATTAANVTSYQDKSGNPGTTYSYCVTAFSDGGGESAQQCNPGTRALVTGATDVAASDGQYEDRVVLTWQSATTRAVLFKIYRDGTAITTVAATTHTYEDHGIASGGSHHYCVSAVTADEVESAQACDDGYRTLAPPTGVAASDDLEDRVSVTWTDNSHAETGYRVERKPAASGSFAIIGTRPANRTAYFDSTATSGAAYVYRVSATDALGVSDGATDNGSRTLKAPTAVSATDGAYEDKILVTWVDLSAAEAGYRIYRRIGAGAEVSIGTTAKSATTFKDSVGVAFGIVYTYRVVAFDAYGESAGLSDVGSTAILPPASVNASDNYANAVTISWVDQSKIEQGYRIYRGGALVTTTGPNVTYYVDAPNLQGGPIAYCVESYSGSAVSSQACDDGFIGTPQTSEFTRDVPLLPGTTGSYQDVHISGDLGVAGTQSGSSGDYIFLKRTNGVWAEEQTVHDVQRTGQPCAIDGERAVIGNHIYFHTGNGWVLSATLNPGGASDIKGDYVALGGADLVYVYFWNGSTWVLQQTIASPGPTAFGQAVAIDGNSLIVGAPNETDNTAYIYGRSGTTWSLQATLPGAPVHGWAFAVDVQGPTAMVGNQFNTTDGGDGVPFVRVYTRTGTTWSLTQTLQETDRAVGSRFGRDISISGDLVLIGARTGGAGFLFHRRNGTWSQIAKLRATGDGSSFVQGVTLDGASGGFNNAFHFHPFDLLLPAADVTASDGTVDKKVQIRWKDQSDNEDGFHVYRDGTLIETVGPNIQSYSDFDGESGVVHEYCVRSFNGVAGDTGPDCDFGWRAPDGAITGRVATRAGAGVEGVQVCLDPAPISSLQLDGQTGYVRADSVGTDALSEMTVECWVRTGDPRTGTLVSFAAGAYANAITLFNTQSLTLFVDDASRSMGGSVADNKWHHVAVTWRSADGQVQLFRDGVNTYTGTGLATGVNIPANGILILGQDQDSFGGGFDVNQALQGEMDDVRLWSVVRSPQQIAADRTKLIDPATAGLVFDMPFDEGTGTYAADLTSHARYGKLTNGAFWSREAAPLDVCGVTDREGNYAVNGIRYGASTTFAVTPSLGPHSFEPAFKSITLAPGNPVQNEIAFNDISSFTLSGNALYSGTTCAEDGAEVLIDDVVVGTTNGEGHYAVAVGFGLHTLKLRKGDHTFTPATRTLDVQNDTGGLDFQDATLRHLTGRVGGGCNLPIGTVHLEVRTENGCYVTTTSSSDNYSVALAPQKYFVRVTDVTGVPAALDRADILEFFDVLGPQAVDLTDADRVQDVTYHAPLHVAISGFTAPGCPTLILPDGTHVPAVPVLAQMDKVPLTIEVYEDYGSGNHCPVDSGTVTIFDEIMDEQDNPVQVEIQNGVAHYKTAANTPNVFAGRIDASGNNRSFQKSITAVAQIPGQSAVSATEWALVTGHRPRAATFTSVSQEVPLNILRDPPGDGSSAFLEKGTRFCTNITDLGLESVATGLITKIKAGVRFSKGTPFWSSETEVGIETENKFKIGFEATEENGVEICAETTQRISTSSDDSWLGGDGDVLMGVALNLVFAKTDVLELNGCQLAKSEAITMGGNGFNTTYLYTVQHIRDVVIPQLRELATLDPSKAFFYKSSADNWQKQLDLNESLKAKATLVENRSFSAGADFELSQTSERTRTQKWSTKVFTNDELALGFVFNETGSGASNQLAVDLDFSYEHGNEADSVTTTTVGYTLADDDIFDFFSVNVYQDSTYATPVFKTVSGRSSCPWEPNTQPRDGVQVRIEPPVVEDVDPDGVAHFTLSLTNVSQADEQREYFIQPVQTTNDDGASIFLVGDTFIQLPVFLEPGQTHNWEMTVGRGPSKYRYDKIAICAISTCQFDYWRKTGVVQLADTAFFSVHFKAPCSDVTLLRPQPGWSVAAGSDTLELVLKDFELAISEQDSLQAVGAEYQLAGTDTWFPIGGEVPLASIPRDGSGNPKSVTIKWPVAGVPQGAYTVRAFSRCSQGKNYSSSASGVIDRSPPQVFGTPQPADGVLSFGEDISITYNEDLDCASANAATVHLETNPGTGMPQAIGVQVACNGRTLVLTPADDLSVYEGQSLKATVAGIKDKVGNASGTRSWTFTVKQSDLAWAQSSLSQDMGFGSSGRLAVDLVNGLGQRVRYTLGALPAWLVPIPVATDTIPAKSQAEVAFTIPASTPLGAYDATVTATATTVPPTTPRTATLNVHLNVLRVPPSWTLDPALFEHAMTVRAKVFTAADTSASADDILAAYVGNEVRGLAHPQHVADGWRYFLTVYGRPPAFERVRFKVWDSRTSITYDATDQALKFVADTTYGSFGGPVEIRTRVPSPANEQVIPVNAGWTWFSVNRRPSTQDDRTVAAVLSNLNPSPGDLVKAQDGSISMFDATAGWVGTLDTLGVTASYRMKTAATGEIRYESARVLPSLYGIPVKKGWNWIGYTPDDARAPASALANLVSTRGDILRSQTTFDEFAPSSWSGGLAQMSPGQGFALYRSSATATTFAYADVAAAAALAHVAAAAPDSAAAATVPGDASAGWKVDDHAFQYDMVVTLRVDELPLSPTWQVAALVGDEVRGIAQPVHVAALNKTLVFLMVRSNRAQGEAVSFEALDRATGKVYRVQGTVTFEADAVQGSTSVPVALHSDGTVIASLLPATFELGPCMPNPIRNQGDARVRYAVASGTVVRIELFDLAGRRVRTIVNGWRPPGWYDVSVGPGELAGGVYFYRMRAGAYSATRRMVVTR